MSWAVVAENFPYLLRGTLYTAALSVAVILLGTTVGLVRFVPAAPLRAAVTATVEVVRGAIQSIPRGQAEAARSTGLSGIQTMRHVLVPQALRRMLPPFVGLCTILVKDTSLAAIIGVFELTRAAQESIERTLHPFELYLTAAAIYFCLCFPLSVMAARAERRLQRP